MDGMGRREQQGNRKRKAGLILRFIPHVAPRLALTVDTRIDRNVGLWSVFFSFWSIGTGRTSAGNIHDNALRFRSCHHR